MMNFVIFFYYENITFAFFTQQLYFCQNVDFFEFCGFDGFFIKKIHKIQRNPRFKSLIIN
ncbi:MAG: hypothetical protein RIS64_2863 [Bacteroidota bacterium]|jgi:hypothetical protein